MSSADQLGMMEPDGVDEVRKYSVLVGFLLVLVFVVPCITLALMAKCFQKHGSRRKNSFPLVSTAGSFFKYMGEERGDTTVGLDSDSSRSGYGVFGTIIMPAKKLECVERMTSVKHQLSCIETWKAHAPPQLIGGSEDCKKLITVLKSATMNSNNSGRENTHVNCLKAELSYLSRIPSHHAMLNLLGVCAPSSNSSAIISALMLECPLYGTLLAFLVCKRLGHISNKNSNWLRLENQKEDDSVLRALPEENRQFLSRLLDDYRVRQRPFSAPLNADFTDLDLLLFALQIADGLQFLLESGILFKQLSSENIVISAGFFLKISCLSPESAFPMHKRTNPSQNIPSRRTTTSGRNMMKWDAPEVIEGNDSDEKSDIWRYGMVLWEISSYGDTPFAEVPGKSLVEMMRKGEVPPLPGRCSNEFYSIMRRCWQIDCSSRPSLDDLTRIILSQLLPFENGSILESPLSPSPPLPLDTPSPLSPGTPSPGTPSPRLPDPLPRNHLQSFSTTDCPSPNLSMSSQAVLLPDSPMGKPDSGNYQETDL